LFVFGAYLSNLIARDERGILADRLGGRTFLSGKLHKTLHPLQLLLLPFEVHSQERRGLFLSSVPRFASWVYSLPILRQSFIASPHDAEEAAGVKKPVEPNGATGYFHAYPGMFFSSAVMRKYASRTRRPIRRDLMNACWRFYFCLTR